MPETLADRIRSARALRYMTQAALAKEIGIATSSMNAIEQGTDPRASRVKKIAQVLKVSTDYLYALDATAEPQRATPVQCGAE